MHLPHESVLDSSGFTWEKHSFRASVGNAGEYVLPSVRGFPKRMEGANRKGSLTTSTETVLEIAVPSDTVKT